MRRRPQPKFVARGRASYGASVGIILLDADLPRPPGDLGNAQTLGFPAHYEITSGADVRSVVEQSSESMLPDFVASGNRLLRRGARAITTNCGFLAIHQQALVAELDAPVATSSLLQVPLVLRILARDKSIGLITINGSTLGEAHLRAVGVSTEDLKRVHFVGLENTEHLYSVIVGQGEVLDVDRAEQEVVDTCTAFLSDHPDVAALVFECTNLPPYSDAVRAATGLPVWDAVSLVTWLNQGFSE